MLLGPRRSSRHDMSGTTLSGYGTSGTTLIRVVFLYGLGFDPYLKLVYAVIIKAIIHINYISTKVKYLLY